MSDNQIETGKRIMLGQMYKEFMLPAREGEAEIQFPIRRMGMRSELLFKGLYDEFVSIIKGAQIEVMDVLKGYIGVGSTEKFGMMEGLQVVSDVFAKLPALQGFAAKAVLAVATAQKVKIDQNYVEEYLGTADCFEILGAQAEAQGLQNSFRTIFAGFSSLSN